MTLRPTASVASAVLRQLATIAQRHASPRVRRLHLPLRATQGAPAAGEHDAAFCAIELDDGAFGLSYVMLGDTLNALLVAHGTATAAPLQGADPLALAQRLVDGSPVERAIALAAINALTDSVWRRLGAEVTILEGLPTFLGAVDEQIAKEAKKAFDKQGLKIELGVKVGEIVNGKKGVTVNYTNAKGEALVLDADKLIISIGRVPNTIGLNAEAVGLQLDERGAIVVDADCKTNLPGVWAVGDVVRGPMLAHKAEEEGVFVAEILAGQKPHINYNLIPGVVYTWPEVAGVGATEEELKKAGTKYKVGSFPMRALGRARASMDIDGLVKVLADATTDEILGMHMIGPRVADLIAEAVVAMEFRASAEDVARMSHAHPTYAEAVKEACLAATDNRAMHV
jgi:hypothetical protein